MSMVVGKKDPYHEFLENFSYAKMLTKIKSYISFVVARRPPVFLLQAATKVVEAKGKLDVQTRENKVHEAPSNMRHNKDQAQTTDDNDSQKEDTSTSECEYTSEEKSTEDINQNKLTEEAANITDTAIERPQRRLFSLEQGTPWHPGKTRVISKSIIGERHCDHLKNLPSEHLETSTNSATNKKKQVRFSDVV